MSIRKLCVALFLGLSLTGGQAALAAGNPFGQTVQINTRFHSIAGKPVWLLVLRDANSGVVTPYLFDIKNNDNFWLALSYGRNYIVTASTLKFGPFAIIHNFCHLQDGVLAGKSIIITLTGNLTPARGTSNCRVLKYNDDAFTVVTSP